MSPGGPSRDSGGASPAPSSPPYSGCAQGAWRQWRSATSTGVPMSTVPSGPAGPATRRTPGLPSTLTGRARCLAAAAVAAVAAVAVAGLVDGVGERGDLTSYDPTVTADAVRVRTPVLTVLAEVVTMVGSEVAVGILTAAVVLWVAVRRRDRLRALHFGATMAVSAAVTLGVKHLVARGRPPAAVVLGPIDTGYSFPSGHTLFSTVFFGLVAFLVADRLAGRRGARTIAFVGWALASVAVAALGLLRHRGHERGAENPHVGAALPRLGGGRGAELQPVAERVEGVDD